MASSSRFAPPPGLVVSSARSIGCVVAACLLGTAAFATAQPSPTPTPEPTSPSEPSPPAPELVAPRAIVLAPITLPTDDVVGRSAGRVVVRVVIAVDGTVGDVEVVESMGPSIDAAAVVAVQASRFEPGRRAGVPMASRIRVAIEVPPGPAPEPDRAAPAPAADAPVAATPAETTPAPTAAPSEASPIEVTAYVETPADAIRNSAAPVTVVETEHDQRRTGDLGEVLARAGGGVTVRRGGGLGSESRIAIDGLEGEQVRYFLDGIPLHLVGFPRGPAQVPVDLVERLEIHRGVTPIRFGADALGGAVALVSEPTEIGTHGRVSYQGGSFGTHRLTLAASYVPERGVYASARGFVDAADNDYVVHVAVPDDTGTPVPAAVRRFHDGYAAQGGFVEVGVRGARYADRLAARVFVTNYRKELQNNLVMSVPYGEADYGQLSTGGAIVHRLARERFELDTTLGYSFGRAHVEDTASCRYDWFGRCVAALPFGGEYSDRASDRLFSDHAGYLRSNTEVRLSGAQRLRFSLAPTVVSRHGEERRLPSTATLDPVAGERRLSTVTVGAEYSFEAFDDRLEAIVFVKAYSMRSRAEEALGNQLYQRDFARHRPGGGAAMTFTLTDTLRLKTSYEAATRLPSPDEVFGDRVLVQANYSLAPELAHNANLGVRYESDALPIGSLRVEAVGFARITRDLIVLLGSDRDVRYQNALRARSLGGDATLAWTSPGEWVSLGGNLTYQDLRNVSTSGAFGTFDGDRIPNRPWFYGATYARVVVPRLTGARDSLSLDVTSRYVGWFYRAWESAGDPSEKQVTPRQIYHTVALVYSTSGDAVDVSATIEVHNLTNARVYDFFGVERPGRAVQAKLVLRL